MSTKLVAEAITEYFGERCRDFDADCICCQAWATCDDLAGLARTPGARAMSKWRPIETAPKDGTRLLAYCTQFDVAYGPEYEAGIATIAWDTKYKLWQVDPRSADGVEATPTKWMPLPEPLEPEQ